MILREYQKNIAEEIVLSDDDVCICLPTGAGKTVIASEIINELNNAGKTVCFIVPRLELLKQASETFKEDKTDIIWSDKTNLTGKKCIVASKDSLITQYKKLPENTILFYDEVHIGLEQTYKQVQKIKPLRVLGLTATPERMDGQALIKNRNGVQDSIHKYAVFDRVLQRETVSSLIKKGFLCPLKYYTKPIEDITEVKVEGVAEELSDDQMTEIFDKNQIWGDLVKSYETYGKGRPALGFTKTVEMAEKVAKIFQDAGYDFRVIHGEMGVRERSELIEDLRSRRIDGLVNSALLTYGFDCPPVSYAFSCRHIKSRPLWFQVVGRILRTSPGKEDAIFVDHGDSISEFAEPESSLPILDPVINWKCNGETKEEKFERKQKSKKIRDALKILQSLDPLPCEMVEIKNEDTMDRFVKVIKQLMNEKEVLLDLVQKVQKSKEAYENRVSELVKENQTLQKKKNELEKKQSEKKTAKAIKQNNFLFMTKDETFEFCRVNYCFSRKKVKQLLIQDPEYKKLDSNQRKIMEHKKTIEALEKRAANKNCILLDATFESSMSYWEKNYKEY